MTNWEILSAAEIAREIDKGSVSENELYSFFLRRIQKTNPLLNCFVEVYDKPVQACGNSPLKGVPIAIKDNICIKGKRITCASKILSSHTAVYDATVIDRLKKAGVRLIGTTNMDEFAFGSSTENSCYGAVKNPWDTKRVPGGSSGGSAAAVAARLVPIALGSDTGGSIRQPAALCGVVGFKPTYGRVSRYGLIAFGSSLDQIGPITTNFEDCAHILNIIAGIDDYDSTSARKEKTDFTQALVDNIAGIKIGIPREYFKEGLSLEVRDAIRQVQEVFEKKKARIIDIQLPHTQYAVATYYIVASSEASSNLQRYDGIRYGLTIACAGLNEGYKQTRGEGFGYEAKRRILLGTYSLSSGYYDAYYVHALKVRQLIKKDFDSAFNQVDAILTPTSPTAAFRIGEKVSDPLNMYLSDVYTIPANMAGLPAVSFPCGFTKDNLPIGAQLMGRAFDEQTLIKLGFSYQRATDFHKKLPDIR